MSQIQPSRPSVDGLPIISGISFAQCGAVNASQDCTADITFASGHVLASYPLLKGYNRIQATKVENISAGTLVALYNEGSGAYTLPPSPLAVSSFENGVYSIGGVSKTAADLWEHSAAFAAYDPSWIIPGQGFTYSYGAGESFTNFGPVTTAALFAAVGPEFVGVADFSLLPDGDPNFCSPEVLVLVGDIPGYSAYWQWYYQLGDPNLAETGDVLEDSARAPDTIFLSIKPVTPGRHKSAYMFCEEQLVGSTDGGAPFATGAPIALVSPNRIALGVGLSDNNATGKIIVHSITLYPELPIELLPQLSRS